MCPYKIRIHHAFLFYLSTFRTLSVRSFNCKSLTRVPKSHVSSPSGCAFTCYSSTRSDTSSDNPGVQKIDSKTQVPWLTILLPAYNEELRIEPTLIDYQSYLETSELWQDRTSILVVDDGSRDGTIRVLKRYMASSKSPITVECVSLSSNGGKGSAISFGIQHILRKHPVSLILTADADGSADINGLPTAYTALVELLQKDKSGTVLNWDQAAVVSGYRTHESASASRLIFRWGFRTVVKIIVGDLRVKDSQCGFKLMTSSAASVLYRDLNVNGWSHDVEVLYRARELQIPIAERNIQWEDKDGSKLVASPGGIPAVVVRMFWEVLLVRWGYKIEGWEVPSNDSGSSIP